MDINKIDEAIKKAKDAQRAKMAKNDKEAEGDVKAPKVKVEKVSDEDKKARTLARAKEMQEKKAARELVKAEKTRAREEEKAHKAEERAARKLAKSAEKMKSEARGPAHMKKVEKAACKLPVLSDELSEEVARLTEAFSVQDLSRLIAHLAHSNRVQSTLNSSQVQLNEGQSVRIVSCENDPGVIGRFGVVAEVRKIRVLVQVPGYTRLVYLFNSDCEPTEEVNSAPVTEEVEEDESNEVEGVSVDEETGFLTVTDDEEEVVQTGTEG